MLKKNETVRLQIEDLDSQGLGIGHSDGVAVFVKDTVIGDEIEAVITKVKKTYAYGRVKQILVQSPDRVTPRCEVARQCGGCQLQMMNYEAQLRFKQSRVKNALERIGGFWGIQAEPVIGMDEPWNYRNKAQYPVGTDRRGVLVCGFYAGRTHAIVPLPEKDGCVISASCDNAVLSAVTEHMERYHIPAYREEEHAGLVRHVLIRTARSTGQIMVCLIINGSGIPGEAELVRALLQIPGMTCIALNRNTDRTNVILGNETRILSGNGYIEENIGPVRYRISVRSFFQVNPVQTEKLYAAALEYASPTGDETVLDLYCGTGTISLFLAQKAKKVYGIEIIEEAVENARINAQENGFSNVEFFAGQAETVLPDLYRQGKLQADVIVVDPPRKGCERAVLDVMLLMAPRRIVYVSCDPATLARDLSILCSADGYHIEKVQPVDMFPHTSHVETVCLLSKLSGAKNHISVKVDMDEMDVTAAESKATYDEIREWVQENYGMHVTNLNIAQVKRKHGIIERENYNKPKSLDSKQPGCPEEKVKAIEAALRFFQMIYEVQESYSVRENIHKSNKECDHPTSAT